MATETRSPVSTSADGEKIAAIRAQLPAVHGRAYLNTGTNGPVPNRSHDALFAYAETELREGRIGPAVFGQMMTTQVEARAAFARLLGCDPLEIALTHNTTEGMNIALFGLDWAPGDEVVSATTEHPGGLHPLFVLKQRYGVKLRMTEIGLKEHDPVDQLRRVLTPRTKAVVLSHVSWGTGMVLPIRELADLAHAAGALFICDAAQACGMVPSRVYDLGVDAYACSGQKWLCGPNGTGALFVRQDRLADIAQTYIGYGGVKTAANGEKMSDDAGNFVPGEGAKRYEAASLYLPAVKALNDSLQWIGEEVGWEWAYRRIAELGRYCYDRLAALEGVTMHSPREPLAGLIAFTLAGVAPPDLTTKLHERGVVIRYTPYPHVNRVAPGFYNTEEEIDRLAAALVEIRVGL